MRMLYLFLVLVVVAVSFWCLKGYVVKDGDKDVVLTSEEVFGPLWQNANSVQLLASKYNIEQVTTEQILKDYLKMTTPPRTMTNEEMFKPSKDSPSPIKELSTKYDLDEGKVASIIIEFRVLASLDKKKWEKQ